jgi:hypothetical protein
MSSRNKEEIPSFLYVRVPSDNEYRSGWNLKNYLHFFHSCPEAISQITSEKTPPYRIRSRWDLDNLGSGLLGAPRKSSIR